MEKELISYLQYSMDVKEIISIEQQSAYSAVNAAMPLTNQHIGKRIVKHARQGSGQYEYNKRLIFLLPDELENDIGKRRSERNLHYFKRPHLYFPDEHVVNAYIRNLDDTLESLMIKSESECFE